MCITLNLSDREGVILRDPTGKKTSAELPRVVPRVRFLPCSVKSTPARSLAFASKFIIAGELGVLSQHPQHPQHPQNRGTAPRISARRCASQSLLFRRCPSLFSSCRPLRRSYPQMSNRSGRQSSFSGDGRELPLVPRNLRAREADSARIGCAAHRNGESSKDMKENFAGCRSKKGWRP